MKREDFYSAYIYPLLKGVRDCTWVDIGKIFFDDAVELLQQYKMKYFISDKTKDKISLFLYKYDHQLILFKRHHPVKCYESHYILGKLFNYSNEAIEEFLSKTHNHELLFTCKELTNDRQKIEKFFDDSFSKESFLDYLKRRDKYPHARQWFIDNIYPNLTYEEFIAIMKNKCFDKYVCK